MKKIYLILLTVVIGSLIGYLYMNVQSAHQQTSKLFTESYKQEDGKRADKPDEFTKYFKSITTKFGEEDNKYPLNYRVQEFSNAKAKAKSLRKSAKASTITWEQRGPANVGGRTRGLIIDPDDANNDTWFAGSATGGIWKTEDRGLTWTCLTDDLPNLSANTLIMAESDHDIIYAGTGESFPGGTYMQGSGIFKSINRGDTWTQLSNTTTENFKYVNRLAVDPTDADIIIAATESGIMKSIDGGTIWTKVYTSATGVEDLDADPNNFNNLYATENSVGVVLSVDGGDTWNLSNNGLEQGTRYELAISPQDPTKIYLSVNNTTPAAYRSTDSGANWEKFKSSDGFDVDFLGGQGDYDNTIAIHPYDSDIAFLGGVNLWKVDFSNPGTTTTLDADINRFDKSNISGFMNFINFSATYFDGILEGDPDKSGATDISMSDFVSVEIRFGPGKTQKAHQFTVGGQGAGVPASGYTYKNYVDVPFEVWDVTNNKQLMVCFRDQEEDGKFDLEAREEGEGADETIGREYLFVNLVDYDDVNPSADIAKTGGHLYKQMYFFWPTLAENGTWDDANLPESKISIGYFGLKETTGTKYAVTNAYGNGDNNYDQGEGMGETSIPGVHPDHHNMVMVKTDETNEKFIIVNANDGGLAISENEGVLFNQLPNNYITTQFYGVAKRPGANEYIGGMQDNGTWAAPDGVNSSETTDYIFHLGGDGFECAWNTEDANKMIGSIYYNAFYKTTNRGLLWSYGDSGIETVDVNGESRNDGPFITKISSNPYAPDVLFSVGYNGIYKSEDFASSWIKTTIGNGWNSEANVTSNYVTNQHNIEVSLANENIVWAGAAMATGNGWSIFVSTDQGKSFSAVNDFTGADLSGYISGIATHPFEDSTAYILFSFSGESKVIRTKDLGQTWEDISGFNGNVTSSNGFPDVVTHCLVVLPNDPSTIWVGTDIGIIESTDDGATWNLKTSDLPAVAVYDMFAQDGQVVIATHGRGIWTADIEEMANLPVLSVISVNSGTLTSETSYEIAFDSVELFVNDNLVETIKEPSTGANTLSYVYPELDTYKLNIIGYQNENMYRSNNVRIDLNTVGIVDFSKNQINHLKVYPNPTQGNVTIDLPENLNKSYTIDVYSLSGSKVYSKLITRNDNQLNLENLNNGIYIMRLENNGEIYSQKVKIQK